MTSDDYRAQLARLGLTQTGAARVTGQAPRTSRQYACGERVVPEPVRRLLLLCERDPTALEYLQELEALDAPSDQAGSPVSVG